MPEGRTTHKSYPAWAPAGARWLVLFIAMAVGIGLSPKEADAFAQGNGGFEYQEAKDLITLCMRLNGTGDDSPLPAAPVGWRRLFPDPEEKQPMNLQPFSNAWELWQQASTNTFAVVVRGTVPKSDSILEDMVATTLEANTALPLKHGNYLPLKLAETQGASTHLGFTWGMAILVFHKDKGILAKLLSDVVPEGSRILIAGHSQGAAIATLIHSFLSYAREDSRYADLARKKLSYKSYVFAQPKPGNWQYAQDFARIAGNPSKSFCVTNDLDWVPQVPLSIQLLDDVTDGPVIPFLKEHTHIAWLASIADKSMRWLRTQTHGLLTDITDDRISFLTENINKQYVVPQSDNVKVLPSPSLNYAAACATIISLKGDPHSSNPKEPNDALWQHHAATYSFLLEKLNPNKLNQ